jgi:phosphate uptake regulator
MVKRKIIQLGTKTLLVSLPSKWARDHKIKKGQEVDVQTHGDTLMVRSGPKRVAPVNIDINGFDSSLVWYTLIAAYRQGLDEVTLTFKDKMIWDRTKLKNVRLLDLLHTITEQLLGWSVAKTTSKTVVIRDLSKLNPEEFDHSVTRTYQTVLTFAEDLLNAIKNNEIDVVETLSEQADKQVNRLVHLSLRLLSKHQPANLSMYHLIVNLEGTGDILRDIAKDALKNNWQNQVNAFTEAIALMRACYEYYLKPVREKKLEIEKAKLELDEELQHTQNTAYLSMIKKFMMESLTAYPISGKAAS